jgi:hypothetical protein
LQTSALAPEGIYQYKVIKAKEGVSNAGNDKIDLTLKIWNDQGIETLVFTNLSLMKLLKHFCDVNHMQDKYNSGDVSDKACEGKSGGCVMIGIEGEKPNPNGGMYKAKNIVKDYITAPHGSTMKPLPEVKSDFVDDTDIPF